MGSDVWPPLTLIGTQCGNAAFGCSVEPVQLPLLSPVGEAGIQPRIQRREGCTLEGKGTGGTPLSRQVLEWLSGLYDAVQRSPLISLSLLTPRRRDIDITSSSHWT